jgi:hypothetical protein
MSRPSSKVRRIVSADSRTGVRTVVWGAPEDKLNG